MAKVDTIIFDLGGVLIDWNPRYMYQTVFQTEEAMEYFLANVCTSEWNEEQDGGRSIAEANQILISQYPQYQSEIEAFYSRWTEMLGGAIAETVEILRKLKEERKYKLVALTNWSAETWPEATARYEFLNWFEGILVSGQEHLKKPDPAIYELLLDRYDLVAERCLFIDDNLRNIKAAEALGIRGFHFGSKPLVIEKLVN